MTLLFSNKLRPHIFFDYGNSYGYIVNVKFVVCWKFSYGEQTSRKVAIVLCLTHCVSNFFISGTNRTSKIDVLFFWERFSCSISVLLEGNGSQSGREVEVGAVLVESEQVHSQHVAGWSVEQSQPSEAGGAQWRDKGVIKDETLETWMDSLLEELHWDDTSESWEFPDGVSPLFISIFSPLAAVNHRFSLLFIKWVLMYRHNPATSHSEILQYVHIFVFSPNCFASKVPHWCGASFDEGF